MKLRIRGNSLRLRLQKKEVHLLVTTGTVVEQTCIGENNFSYSLETHQTANTLHAALDSKAIRIFIPAEKAKQWAESDAVSIFADQPAHNGTLKILIEKDFACIKPRTSALWEDDSDAFPNPNPSCGG